MPSVTLVCKQCDYTARRRLLDVTACRGIHETPSEPASCPNGHGPLIRKDGFYWEGSSNPGPAKQHNWRLELITISDNPWGSWSAHDKCIKCGATKSRDAIEESECPGLTSGFHLKGYYVRNDDPNDRTFITTKDLRFGLIFVRKGCLVQYNGKSILVHPSKHRNDDEETNHPSIEVALRRGWLKPYVEPSKLPTKIVGWVNGLFKKN